MSEIVIRHAEPKDYDAIRQIWVNHLKALYNDAEAWETGEDYQ